MSIWMADSGGMPRPTDKPYGDKWVVRWNSGQMNAASFEELYRWKRSGRIANGYFFHPTAQEWVLVESIEQLTICRQCGYVGTPVEESKLNGCVLVVLLFLFIIPGIIYWVWGATSRGSQRCRNCNAADAVVPVTAPNAFAAAAAVAPGPVGFCASCGKYHQGKAAFCPNCGARTST